jgi:glycerophosphoryl diester phosphodiesterase
MIGLYCVFIEAIAYGLEKHGSHAIEYDVQLSADDVPILHHDSEMGRTVHCPGLLVDYTAEELDGMDAGAWHSARFVGAGIPRYQAVVAYCRAHMIWMNVEVKGDFSDHKQLRKIGYTVATLTRQLFKNELSQRRVNYHSLPLISSFSVPALEEALIAAPEIPRALLVRGLGSREGFIANIEALLTMLEQLEASACHINQEGLTRHVVAALLGHGYGVMCYTVNCPKRLLELQDYGVQAICTDMFDLDGSGSVQQVIPVSRL